MENYDNLVSEKIADDARNEVEQERRLKAIHAWLSDNGYDYDMIREDENGQYVMEGDSEDAHRLYFYEIYANLID